MPMLLAGSVPTLVTGLTLVLVFQVILLPCSLPPLLQVIGLVLALYLSCLVANEKTEWWELGVRSQE